jgi:hypothetical protein
VGGSNNNSDQAAARAMLDCFASAGATAFDVTWTNSAGEPRRFREAVAYADLTRTLPAMLQEATGRRYNLIVRPHGPAVAFIQLDDLSSEKLARTAAAALLTLETSPDNFQAWLALAGDEDKEFASRVRRGSGADVSASGATRVAGSINWKDKYAPDFPRIEMRAAHLGRKVTAAELEQLGLVAAPVEYKPLHVSPARTIPGSNRKWPDYGRCLDGAPQNSEGTGPDTSRADIVWCMTAITWGFGVEETAQRLMEEPDSKAFERGEHYATNTARKAALYVQQRKGQPRQRIAR